MHFTRIEPTVFFARGEGDTRQKVAIGLSESGGALEEPVLGRTRLRFRARNLNELLPLSPSGDAHEAWFPDLRERQEVWLGLEVDGEIRDERAWTWEPGRHWEVHLIQYAHHDLGYTDLPSNVLAEYLAFMDDALRFCAETETWPEEEARFRYLCEQAWSVVHYLERRPPEVAQRLAHYCRNGQMEVTALFGNQTLELCSHEELIRLLYPSFRLKRELGIPISSAEHNDIPGFSWGLASALAGAGVRYFSPGVPLWYFGEGEKRVHPLWDTERALPLGQPAACWWEGPDGARVLLWLDIHGHEWQPYDVDQAVRELPGMLADLESGGYPYELVSYTLRGGHRDNAPPSLRYAYLVREWNRRWAYPRLINTTNTPFLQAFETRYGDTLKTLRGDVPGTDYPAAATCTPRETGIDRNTHEWLMAAEKYASWASLNPSYRYPAEELGSAYRQTFFYDLHCWGLSHVGGPGQDGHWSEKGGFAYRAAALAHDAMVKAANALVDQIAYPRHEYYMTLFNPLSHEWDSLARVPLRAWSPCGSPMYWELPAEQGGWPSLRSGRALGRKIVDAPKDLLDHPFEVVDLETGEAVPYQLVTLRDGLAAERWAPERYALHEVDARHLTEIVFPAQGLPAMGYRSYGIRPCQELRRYWPPEEVHETATSVENAYYALAWDIQRGGVVRLRDKELDQELVDGDAAHPLGALIVRSSASAEQELLHLSDARIVQSGPHLTTVRLLGSASCCPRVVLEITLYHGVKRVDVNYRILRDSTPLRELYVAFPFAVQRPQFHFEAPGSVMRPILDQWPGSNTDYYGVGHWADVSNDGWGVTWAALDTPMAEFGGLWPGYVSGAHHGVRGPGYGHPFLEPGQLERAHIYALVSYNNFRTNFINVAPGEYVIRYALTSHDGGWRASTAWGFGWGAHNPPLSVWTEGPGAGPLPVSGSFCQVDASNVVVLTWKQAEDGRGYIVRLMETAGVETPVTVNLPSLDILHAWETNLVEEDQRLLPYQQHAVRTSLGPLATRTLRIQVA